MACMYGRKHISYLQENLITSFCFLATTVFIPSQAVADTVFTFDQATFHKEMGSDIFPLADYYKFEYSQNLTATPESPSLLLFGTGLLGLIGLSLRTLR
jgi:hypothetical protein